MEETKQPTFIINDWYRITSDGSRNLILQEKYETRVGRGKGAELSGEYSWRDVGFHGSNMRSLRHRFKDDPTLMKSFNSQEDGLAFIEACDKIIAFAEKIEDEVLTHFNEHITLQLSNVKAPSEEKQMTMSAKKPKK